MSSSASWSSENPKRDANRRTPRRAAPTCPSSLISCVWKTLIQNPTPFLQPAHDGHARADADRRFNLENVDQTFGAGEPFAPAAPRGEAVAHGGADVGDAGAAVL